jgi:hypothetical protein
MKGNYPYGEQKALARLPNVTVAVFGGPGFVDPRNVKPEDKAEAKKVLLSISGTNGKMLFSNDLAGRILRRAPHIALEAIVGNDERFSPGFIADIITKYGAANPATATALLRGYMKEFAKSPGKTRYALLSVALYALDGKSPPRYR